MTNIDSSEGPLVECQARAVPALVSAAPAHAATLRAAVRRTGVAPRPPRTQRVTGGTQAPTWLVRKHDQLDCGILLRVADCATAAVGTASQPSVSDAAYQAGDLARAVAPLEMTIRSRLPAQLPELRLLHLQAASRPTEHRGRLLQRAAGTVEVIPQAGQPRVLLAPESGKPRYQRQTATYVPTAPLVHRRGVDDCRVQGHGSHGARRPVEDRR